MKRLLCAPTVGLLCAICAFCFAACSTTDQPTVAVNSNQAVVTNSNTATATTATTTANTNLAATPLATTAPATTSTPVTNANNSNAAPTKTTTPATTAAVDFKATRAQYAQHCAMCHGAGGEGMKMGTVNYPSLKVGSRSDAQINDYITNGHEGMPAFKGKLSAAQISTMVRYIRQELQGKK